MRLVQWICSFILNQNWSSLPDKFHKWYLGNYKKYFCENLFVKAVDRRKLLPPVYKRDFIIEECRIHSLWLLLDDLNLCSKDSYIKINEFSIFRVISHNLYFFRNKQREVVGNEAVWLTSSKKDHVIRQGRNYRDRVAAHASRWISSHQ